MSDGTESPPRIRLVTRGDDAGTCRSANEAIHDACVNGMLRNASFMAPCPELDHAAELLRDLPGLCIGLHTTFTSELDAMKLRPVLPVDQVPSIVDENGFFYHTGWPLAQTNPVVDELVAEFRAQLALLRAKGLNVEYIDEHMSLAALPELRAAMAETAQREGLVLALDHQSHWLKLPEGSFEMPVHAFLAALEAAALGDHIFVGHPCYDTEEVQALWTGRPVPVGHMRDWERRMFMDPEVLDYCRRRGIQPIRYTDLPAA
jgi:predicted glycoside hydrolase/deacetylase ChbG (UPF0249 family)